METNDAFAAIIQLRKNATYLLHPLVSLTAVSEREMPSTKSRSFHLEFYHKLRRNLISKRRFRQPARGRYHFPSRIRSDKEYTRGTSRIFSVAFSPPCRPINVFPPGNSNRVTVSYPKYWFKAHTRRGSGLVSRSFSSFAAKFSSRDTAQGKQRFATLSSKRER